MADSQDHPLKLRNLGFFARLGVAGFVIAAIGGAAVSGLYLFWHHDNRDERAGLTIDDVTAHYHGIVSEARLLAALEEGHPEDLADGEREKLIGWLRGDSATMSQTYDSLDLGADAPAEIIAVSCLDCHSRTSEGPDAAPEIALEYWDDVEALSVSRDVQPVPLQILAASTHTHALGMASIGIAIGLLALLTSWPRALVGLVLAATGIGLAADLSGWWITRSVPEFAYVVVAGGAAFSGGMSLLGVMVLLDLCLPKRKRKRSE
ncbi:MAG: hypothetical protein CMJ31_01625 [Phycisphaerae bacterium]|nr:hypothetical protein [Phycisphaerae bacterium]